MPGEFRMPSLGADMDAGTLLEWHVKPGDVVRRGDIIALVDTDKAAIDVESFEDGVVEELLVPEGTRVPVGTVVARLRTGAEPPPPPPPPPPAADVPAPMTPGPAAPRPPASPLIRRLARTLGVDLARVQGSGKGGAIRRVDVERAASQLPAPPSAEAQRADGQVAVAPPPVAGAGQRRAVSPWARRLAREHGIDLDQVQPGQPGGPIVAADVQAALQPTPGPLPTAAQAPAQPAAQAPASRQPSATPADRQAAMRQAIAALMARSKREIPHYYLATEIDLHHALAWLEAQNQARPVTDRLLPAAMLLKAAALAARQIPEMNGFVIDGRFQPSEHVHLGVAVSLRQGGLIAPAIHDADRKDLGELMRALRDLVQRARAGRLRSSEMADPTITVTNLGDQGVQAVFGVIYPPQVALVGFGKITERPWAEGGMVGARPAVTATLSADHRVSDGHRGGLFLATVGRLLQHPEEL